MPEQMDSKETISGELLSENTKSEEGCISYEELYYKLWETARRYSDFCQFRVIGSSHDERMIPMLEIGNGDEAVFCMSGCRGTEPEIPQMPCRAASEYCQAYESGWMMEDFYEVKKLLSQIRICMIPLVNPDGFEICRKGYKIIRNPIYRQMLRMQDRPLDEFVFNGRGVDLCTNFPASDYRRRQLYEEPASENETKALMRIFQEYQSRGLLSFTGTENKILYYRQRGNFMCSQRSYRMAKNLQKHGFTREGKSPFVENFEARKEEGGSPEQYYSEFIRQPALAIMKGHSVQQTSQLYRDIRQIPLEYIYSLIM